eukprot:3830932-Pyramimonas_sp.AAC.1
MAGEQGRVDPRGATEDTRHVPDFWHAVHSCGKTTGGRRTEDADSESPPPLPLRKRRCCIG